MRIANAPHLLSPLLVVGLALTVLLPPEVGAYLTLRRIVNAESRNARCLDGSGAGYYLYRNETSTRWIIHLESGIEICIGEGLLVCQLYTGSSGTSNSWPCVLPEIDAPRLDDVGVLVSSDSRRNPEFYKENRVFVRHCSGDLFIGNRSTPYNGVYFNGHNIVTAVVEDLIAYHGLGSARQVLFGGASLGAVTNAAAVRRMLPTDTLFAAFSDGVGIPVFPTLRDLQPSIAAHLQSGGDYASFTYELDLENRTGLLEDFDTIRQLQPYIPEPCRQRFNGTVLGGLECLEVATGVAFGYDLPDAFFMFLSTWDTLQLAAYMRSQPYTCAVETGQLSEEEAIYVRALGDANRRALIAPFTYFNNGIRSVYLSNCYTNTFLEDELLCSLVNGVTPYQAMSHFISEAIMGRNASLIAAPPTNLSCDDYCGARQCDWGRNPPRNKTAGDCGQQRDGFQQFRTGALCPGESPPEYAASTAGHSIISRYDVINATERNAICLDGSPGVYYIRRNPDSSNWIIHLQGGDFCATAQQCQAAAQSRVGSSQLWRCSLPGEDLNGGYASVAKEVSGDPDLNPAFYTWNRVYYRACTTDLWTGRNPRATNPFGVNHVGHFLLMAGLLDLEESHGLLDAETIIYAGTSAGGVGMHSSIDDFREQITSILAARQPGRSPPQIYGLSDAGWFRQGPNLLDFFNNPTTAFSQPENNSLTMSLVQLLGGVYVSRFDATCVANQSTLVPALFGLDCLSAAIAWPYIDTPIFLISSAWDYRDLPLRFGVARYACASITRRISALERAFLVAYSEYSYSVLDRFQTRSNGLFFSTCMAHDHFEFAPEIGITAPCDDINGTSAYQAFVRWFNYISTGNGSNVRLLGERATTFRCAPNCRARQCDWAVNNDTANTTCPALTPDQLEISQYSRGEPCMTPTMQPPTPTPTGGSCPAADRAGTADERYEALFDCWTRAFNEYQEAFGRYSSGECGGR